MDMLDPLEASESVQVDSKLMLNEINIKPQAMDSDDCDDEGNVDHLSPQTLLETPGEHEVQYSLRSPEDNNVITYRVVQVDESSVDGVPQIVSAESPGYGNTSSAVLTSNLNGQLYVIGNANEMFATHGGGRTIAPRSSVLDGGSGVVCNLKKRDDRRRATHNEVERRRRDKINNWITKLASIIPDTSSGEIRANGLFDGQSKGGILAKACDYILDMRNIHEKYEALSKKHEVIVHNAEMLKIKNLTMERENKELKAILKKHGILYVPNELPS